MANKALRPWNFRWLPSEIMTMVGNPFRKADLTQYQFRCPPKMTKPEISEYLKKIYGMDVVKVNTMNYDGKFKRRHPRNPNVYFKTPAFKKAIVTVKQIGETIK